MSRPARVERKGLVLAAHGSRRHPEANAQVRRLAQEIRERRLFDEVAVAFHQGEPGFDSVLDEMEADQVTVVPLLTSAGHYAETVLPQALERNRRFAQLRLRQTPPVGTHPGVASLVARRLTDLFREQQLSRSSVRVIVAGHGTKRHGESRDATLALAETLRRRRVAGEVVAGFIDDEPSLEEVTSRQTSVASRLLSGSAIVVVPFLLGGGAHVLEDIPNRLTTGDRRLVTGHSRLATGDWRLLIDHPLGDYPGLADIIVDLARRHAPPPPRFPPRGRSVRIGPGRVHLVGGGPGDPGLITRRGAELLRAADVVIHDRLIGPELLGEARPDAILIDVGKGPGHASYSQAAINDLLVEHARRGRTVVRLKGGDPFVFGRGSEEMEECRAAGVQVDVVPGITSAIAAPAAAGIPVTARGVAQSFTVIAGQVADRAEKAGRTEKADRACEADGAVSSSALSESTIVILMGRENLGAISRQLIEEGRDPATPAACIQSATTPEQRVTRATLATIADAADRDGLESPVVTVIGAVAALGGEDAHCPDVHLIPSAARDLARGHLGFVG
jgi:uroporphyrin-III C-methyltransferase